MTTTDLEIKTSKKLKIYVNKIITKEEKLLSHLFYVTHKV